MDDSKTMGDQPIQKLSPAQCAERWGVSRMTVYRMLKERQIPGAIKLRNQWRIPANALEQTR